MSSAKKDEDKFSSCLHVRKFVFAFFHRAKPVSEKERSGFERALRRREKRKESRPIEHETLSSADSGIHSSKRASHESSMKSHRTCHAASIALKTPSVATPQ